MSLTFDPDYETLLSAEQLIGKTIARVVPHYDPQSPDDPPQSWTLEFTDGDVIDLKASYDDSNVHFLNPGRDK